MTAPMITRNASLEDLAAELASQHSRKLDIVVPANKLRAMDGTLHVDSDDVVMDEAGVTQVRGAYRPTDICDEGLAETLKIPVQYLRRLRQDRVFLYDANVNGHLHGRTIRRGGAETVYPGDDRSFLLRCFRRDDSGVGVARALLSNKYARIDNIDVLTAGLDAVRQISPRAEVVRCNLTERRMRITISVPEIAQQAPALLQGYRNPFDQPGIRRAGRNGDSAFWRRMEQLHGRGAPVVFAGVTITNSETGDARFTIVPEMLILVCRNGQTFNALGMARTHLGARLEDGVIQWSDATRQKALELVKSQTTDAVRAFLSPGFLSERVAQVEALAGAPVTEPETAVKALSKSLGFSDALAQDVLAHFIAGGQLTAGGVLNAVTSVAQTIVDPDEAADVQAKGIQALELAAARR